MQLAYISLAVLFVVAVVAEFRIASIICLPLRWLSVVPIINVWYFTWISDRLAVESYDGKHFYNRFVFPVLLVLVIVSAAGLHFAKTPKLMIGFKIFFICTVIFACLNLAFAYVCVIVDSFKHAMTMCALSLIVPFPVVLLIASFTVKARVEEVQALYLEL